MEKKKPTKAQIERRLQNAVLHIDKTKDTQSIYLSDKGLRLTVDNDYAIIETLYHRHVFNAFTATGVSRPWLYTKRIIEIANENDCKIESGYSFAKLLEVLKAKKDHTEYNLAVYTEWWIFNCFQPLYSIGESEVESFLVYEAYLHNIARNSVFLSEKTEDMTDKQFLDKVIENIKEYTGDIDERVIFPKLTDEERMRQEMEAIREQELNEMMEAQVNGSQD